MAENRDQILHFNEYFKIIRNRLWVIFTIFALTVLSGVYVTEEVLPKIYTSTASIQILSAHVNRVHGMNPGTDVENRFDPVNFQAEFEIMQSPKVIVPIITDLQLDKVWAKRLKSSQDALSSQEAVTYMKQQVLKIDYTRGTNIINITAASEVPKEAAAIANAEADRYKAMRGQEEEDIVNQGTDALKDQIAQQQKLVDDKRAEVEKMRNDLFNKGVPIPNTLGPSYTPRSEADLEARKHDLLTAQEDYDARRVLLESVIKICRMTNFSVPWLGWGAEPDIQTLHTEILTLDSDVDNMLKDGFGPDNPPGVLSINAEILAKQQQISDAIAGLRRAMKVDTDMAKSRVDLLQQQVDDLNKKVLADTSSAVVPFGELQRQLEQQESLLDALNVRLKGGSGR